MTRKSHFILKAIFWQALTFTPYGVKNCKKQKDVKMLKIWACIIQKLINQSFSRDN